MDYKDMGDPGSHLLRTDAPTAAELHYPTSRFVQAVLIKDVWYVQFEVSMFSGVRTIGYVRGNDGHFQRSPSHYYGGPLCETLKRQSAEFIRPAVSIIEKPTRTRLRRSVRLLCPRLIRDERSRDPDILLSIGTILNPADTIGAELKVVFRALGALGEIDGDNSFWLRKCRELMLRPAVEPLLLARWNKLKSFEMTAAEMASFCSLLCGSKQQARTRDSYGLWQEGDVRFEPAEQAASWWNDIRAVASDPQLSSLLPAYAFARTIIAHPFPDGNGRLARALVHASLARIYDPNAPVLPLAPAFYMHGAKVAAALRHLSDSGDWEQFATVFRIVLDEASRLAQRSRGSS